MDKMRQMEDGLSLKISVDTDCDVGYERNNFFKKLINIFLIPLLNAIPSSLQGFLKRTHTSARRVIEHATTHDAVEVLYNYGFRKYSKTLLHRFSHLVWFNTNNAKALRNRLRLVKRELRSHVERIYENKKKIRLLSIAAGSSRSIVELLRELHREGYENISATFLDKSPDALAYSRALVGNSLKTYNLVWVEKTVGTFFRDIDKNNDETHCDVIEMVGLMDYFSDEKATVVFRNIYEHLEPGGVLVTANISDNKERPFVTNAVGWKMIYRDASQFATLLINAGFKARNLRVLYEPLKIHCVVVAQK